MADRNPISILGLGLDTRFRAMLQVFFDRRRLTRYQFVNHQADIVIADMDAWGVRGALADYREQNHSQPTILFSIDENEYKTSGDMVVLRKPFTVKQLVSAFDIMDLRFRVGKQRLTSLTKKPLLNGHSIESGKGADKARQQAESRAHFNAAASLSGKGEYVKLDTLLSRVIEQDIDAEGNEYDATAYLQGALTKAYHEAREKKKNIVIEFGSGKITVDTKHSIAQMGIGGFQLRELASFPLNMDKINIAIVPRRQARVDTESGKTILSFDALVWKVALFASRGRAPRDTNLNAPLRLKSWPNFTRLVLSPGVLRMAALWAAHPTSILQLSKTLKLSKADVLNFYSALHAIDLIEFVDAEDDKHLKKADPGERSNKPSRVKGLLGSILKKLHT